MIANTIDGSLHDMTCDMTDLVDANEINEIIYLMNERQHASDDHNIMMSNDGYGCYDDNDNEIKGKNPEDKWYDNAWTNKKK